MRSFYKDIISIALQTVLTHFVREFWDAFYRRKIIWKGDLFRFWNVEKLKTCRRNTPATLFNRHIKPAWRDAWRTFIYFLLTCTCQIHLFQADAPDVSLFPLLTFFLFLFFYSPLSASYFSQPPSSPHYHLFFIYLPFYFLHSSSSPNIFSSLLFSSYFSLLPPFSLPLFPTQYFPPLLSCPHIHLPPFCLLQRLKFILFGNFQSIAGFLIMRL